MPEYSTDITKRGAFVVDSQRIKILNGTITKFLGRRPSIEIEFEGSYKISGSNLDELLADPYVGSKIIRTIQFSGYADERRMTLRLGTDFNVARLVPVDIDIVSDNHNAMILARNTIEETITSHKQWYWIFMLPDIVPALIGYILFVPIVAGLFVFGTNWLFHLEMINEKYISGYLVLAWAILATAIFYLKQQMFPKMIFDFGKSAEVARNAAWWRNFVGLVVIVGIIVGVIGALIVERIR